MASYPYDDCGSGWPRDFPEYGMSTQEGDIAVHRMVTLVTTEIKMGRCRRIELEGRVKLGVAWVGGLGHHEVLDTVPQDYIEDAINRACLVAGWERLVREVN
jgi:hypothetical protein